MREILFRGKRLDNGEWVEGFVVKQPSAVQIGESSPWYISVPPIDPDDNGGYYNVIPETVGQYTGLCDKNGKNGKKIFEGDIVKTQPFYDKPYSDKRKAKQFIGVVTYKVSTFKGNRFYSNQDYSAEWGLKFNEDFGKFTHYSWGELWNCEVIGNIHDNPELLKGE